MSKYLKCKTIESFEDVDEEKKEKTLIPGIKNKFLLAVLSLFILISGCNSLPKIPKPDWSKKPIEPNARKRAQQNVIDGKGINFGGKKSQANTNFSFASSPLLLRYSKIFSLFSTTSSGIPPISMRESL